MVKSFGQDSVYLSLPPTRQDLTQGQKPEGRLNGDNGEEEVGNEPRLEPCWSVLLIDSLGAIWAEEASNFTKPNMGPGTYTGLWLELDSKV